MTISPQQFPATDGRNSSSSAAATGIARDEKMEKAPANSSPSVKSQKLPPAAGRRMRSASNIAVVEAPSISSGSKTNRPIQRAIRETFEEEAEKEAEKDKIEEKKDEAEVKQAAESQPEADSKPKDDLKDQQAEAKVEAVAEAEAAVMPETAVSEHPVSKPIAASAVETSTSSKDEANADDIGTDAVAKDQAELPTDQHTQGDAITNNESNQANSEPSAVKEPVEKSSQSKKQVTTVATEPKPDTEDDNKMQIDEKNDDRGEVVAGAMDVVASDDEAADDQSNEKVEKSKVPAQEKEVQQATLESSVEKMEKPASERPESTRSMQMEIVAEADSSLQERQADSGNNNAAAEFDAVSAGPEQKSGRGSSDAQKSAKDENVSNGQGSKAGEDEKNNDQGKSNGEDIVESPDQVSRDVKDEAEQEEEEEEEAAEEEEEEEEEASIEKPRVQVYGSTVSGNRTYKKQAKELFTMLEANEIDFEFICIAVDEDAKKYMRRKALGNMTIPQIYVDGDFKGFFEDAFQANEIDELYEWLGLDEEPVDY
ncbi:hypothetical protein H4R99_005194 [Coemansia sp. RSA 1722]|nr:hypothetical protein IWW45_000225 [Coemansia sp. RSA 485]KAJ2595811.1 hypothetical protein H4R99_005194 [Coemansia sp. RSA 1722]